MQFEHALEGVDLGPGVAHFRKANCDIETLGFDLFLGADGAFSRTQEFFCNQFRVERTREISDWKYIEFEIPAHDSAGHGLDPTCLHLWPRDDSLICAIPNNDGTFVANLIMRGELFAQLKGELRSRMFMGARFNDLLDLMGGRTPDFGSLKVSDIVTTAVAKWSFSGKAVLMGDACHAISPFLGQGMNAALEDAFLLVDCLRADGRSLSDSLKFFESSRKSDTDALARLSRLHLEDLRSNLGSPWKIAGARAELIMSRRFPRHIQPKYSLVAHSNLPYSVALRESGKNRRLAARITLACLQSCIFLSRSVAARPNRTDTNIKRGPV
jgi:kynurenine 3-monooxygenase